MKYRQALEKNLHPLEIISLTYTIPFTDQIASLDVHIDDLIIIDENVESSFIVKVRKMAKIRNQYNQVPRLTQDTTWESDKITIRHQKQEPRGQPFPSR